MWAPDRWVFSVTQQSLRAGSTVATKATWELARSLVWPGRSHGHRRGPRNRAPERGEDRQRRVYLLTHSSRSRLFPGPGREDIRLETQRADPRVLHRPNLCCFLTTAWLPAPRGGTASLGPNGPSSHPQLSPSPVTHGSTQGPQCRANWPFETCVILFPSCSP